MFCPPYLFSKHLYQHVLTFFLLQTCVTTLVLRNMVQPFKPGFLQTCVPMADILGEITGQMQELKRIKEGSAFEMAPS